MSHILTEGGQITTHRFRMFRQVLKVAFSIYLFITVILVIYYLIKLSPFNYQVLWYYFKALAMQGVVAKIEVDRQFLNLVTHSYYQVNSLLTTDYVLKITTPIVTKLFQNFYLQLIGSLWMASYGSLTVLAFFFYRGLVSKNKKHLSGSKIISASFLKGKLKLQRKASYLQIGSLPLIKGSETQHLMITGGTGSGKTNCLHHLLTQIREKKQKALIIDTTGVFVERYYRQDFDILLNPLDKRSAHWNPWAEGITPADFASLAEAFIPLSTLDSDNYWKTAARSVLIELLTHFANTQKTSELMQWLQREKLSKLCKILEGTKACAHMDISSEKTASSIRSVACSYLEGLESLSDTDTPFSIQQWLQKEDSSWLFLQCTPQNRAFLRPLLSTWISSAIRALLALPINLDRRIWFSIDEMPTLQKINALETLLTEGRKYGGCGILTLQSPAQLESIYGRDLSKIILGNTATKIIFRERDAEIAELLSRSFGNQELLETQEGITYGAHEARDGVNLSRQNKIRPVVSATQILELPINTAYVKLSEGQAVTKVQLPILFK